MFFKQNKKIYNRTNERSRIRPKRRRVARTRLSNADTKERMCGMLIPGAHLRARGLERYEHELRGILRPVVGQVAPRLRFHARSALQTHGGHSRQRHLCVRVQGLQELAKSNRALRSRYQSMEPRRYAQVGQLLAHLH